MAALEKLKILSREPLGTPSTELVEELIDAILEYETRHAREKPVSKE